MHNIIIEEREWSNEARESWRKFEEKIVDAIINLDKTLWKDVVRFLNRHWRQIIAVHLAPISAGEDEEELIAVFWMESIEKETIWCELHHYELGDPIGLTLHIRNPEKENK